MEAGMNKAKHSAPHGIWVKQISRGLVAFHVLTMGSIWNPFVTLYWCVGLSSITGVNDVGDTLVQGL